MEKEYLLLFGKITNKQIIFIYLLTTLFVVMVIILSLINSINSQFIANDPLDQYTLPSKAIVLKCTIGDYSSDTDLIEWCKNNFCTWGRPLELSDGRLQYKSLSRYFITGNRNKGNAVVYN